MTSSGNISDEYVGVRDTFKSFRLKYPGLMKEVVKRNENHKHFGNMNEVKRYAYTQTFYCKIIKLFFRFIGKKLLRGKVINIPALGDFYIGGFKPTIKINENGVIRGLNINHKATNAHRKANPGSKDLIYYLNQNTEGRMFRFFWKKDTLTHASLLYYFKPYGSLRKKLAKELNDGRFTQYQLFNKHYYL